MAYGKHQTSKKPGDSTYSAKWSGVTFSPVIGGIRCETCSGHLHKESDSKYCPHCDDFKRGVKGQAIR